MFTKKNLIYSLVVFALLLIMINIVWESTLRKEIKKDTPKISKTEIESRFKNALFDFGIDSLWIKKITVKKNLSDSLNYIWRISIPKDVIIASVIREINNRLITEPVIVEATEKSNYGSSVLEIYSDGILKLYAKLNYSKKIKRIGAVYSFIVKADFENDEIPFEKLERNSFPFTYLITPSKEAKEKIKKIKNYALLIDDKILDTEYTLSEDYSKQRLINNLRSIILDFGKKRLFLIDKTSEVYNSKIFNMLRDEFKKRGVKLIPLQTFPKLKGKTDKQLISLFRFYAVSLRGKEEKTFVVELKDFLKLIPEINKQIRRGDKVKKVIMN